MPVGQSVDGGVSSDTIVCGRVRAVPRVCTIALFTGSDLVSLNLSQRKGGDNAMAC